MTAEFGNLTNRLVTIWTCVPTIALLVAGSICSSDTPQDSLPTASVSPVDASSPAPVFSVVPGSTQKTCQLTGEYDYHEAAIAGVSPEQRPTLNRTYTSFGFHGTDLGSSFEHDGKLWFLFGDTFATETIPGDPDNDQSHSNPNPVAADATAYTTDTDPTDCVSPKFIRDPHNPNAWMSPSFDPVGAVVQHERFQPDWTKNWFRGLCPG